MLTAFLNPHAGLLRKCTEPPGIYIGGIEQTN